jgi:hypothetical protein
MKLLILNDLHIGTTRESSVHPGVIRQANTQAAETLQQVVTKLKSENFDLVVQMGDILRDELVEAEDIASITTGLQLVSQLPFPTIHLLGNHELIALPREKLTTVFKTVTGAAEFYGYKEYPAIQIIWLDLELTEKNLGKIPEGRAAWIRSQVKPNKPILIFTHYGFFSQNPTGHFYSKNDLTGLGLALTNGQACWNDLQDLPILAIINAHVHWAGYQKMNQTHLITVPAFSENIASNNPENNPGIYSILETDGVKLTLKSYSGEFCFFNLEL